MSTLRDQAERIVAAARPITLASVEENGCPRPTAVIRLPSKDGVLFAATDRSGAESADAKTRITYKIS